MSPFPWIGQSFTPFACGLMVLLGSRLARADVVYVDSAGSGTITRVAADGTKSTFASGLSNPSGMAVDSGGNLYVAQGTSVRRITPGGTVSTFATGPNVIDGLGFDSSGNLYAASESGNAIEKITPDGSVSTPITLTDAIVPVWDGGTLYVSRPAVIVKIAPDGTLSSFASGITPTGGLALGPDGNFYAAATDAATIWRITPAGQVNTFAQLGFTGSAATSGIAFDSSGNLYAPQYASGTLTRIAPDGTKTMIATGLSDPRFVAIQVPEPATFGFIAAAALLLLRARSRSIREVASTGRES